MNKIALSPTLIVIGVMTGAACGGPGPAEGTDLEEVAATHEALAALGDVVITIQEPFSKSPSWAKSHAFNAPAQLWIGARCHGAPGQTVIALEDYYYQYYYRDFHHMPCDGKLYRFPVSGDHFVPGNPYVLYWEILDNTPASDVTLVAWRVK